MSHNNNFIQSIFENEVFEGYEKGTTLSWDNDATKFDHYALRVDTFYAFDPSEVGLHPYANESYFGGNDISLSGRVYNESNYIASIDGIPKMVPIEEGLGRENIKTFPFSIEDDFLNGTVLHAGIEFPFPVTSRDKSNILDMRLVAEWWHWSSQGWNAQSSFWWVPAKDITENLYLSKPIISFSEDTIRPMEIHSKAHLISGSEDGSSVLNVYSGWDKVAGVWFDENVDIQYSGKDRIARTPSEKAESYSIYEIPDSGYQHYENEIYTQYKIVYSGEPANKYTDKRNISFTKNDREITSIERKITRASSTGDFFDDWEVLSENATSPFADSEILTDYVSEKIPIEEEDVYEVVPYTGNIDGDQDYVEINIIPSTGWSENPHYGLPHCMKEDELFFRDGCNLRIRQEGRYHKGRQSNFSEVMVYFQDTNSLPLSGYKVEFQSTPPDENRIYQLQNVAKGLSDSDEVYFVGQAKGEGGSVGEAVYDSELFSIPPTDREVIEGSSRSSSESSRKLDSAIGFGMSKSIPRGESIVPRTVPEEEYSNYVSGQKYIMSPHGAYSEYNSAKSFSSAGVLYSNFGDISFQNDFKYTAGKFTIDTYALYEQKLNIENKVYSKDEKEIRIFESGACDGFSLTHHGRSDPEDLRIWSWAQVKGESAAKDPEWVINIQKENGRELGIRTGIISCEPEGVDEENYFFSSNDGEKDKFLGYERLNYFLNKDYVTGVNGNILQMVVYPDERVELDLPKDLFDGDNVYYVERDVYVDKNIDSQANDVEPEISQQNKLSANISNDVPYITQTFHALTKNNEDEWAHSSSPLRRKKYFNLQLKTKEFLDDTNSRAGCVVLENPVKEGSLVIPETERKSGCMLQRSEGKYFPDSDGATASGTSMVFDGLTIGNYYEFQKRGDNGWQGDTDIKPTTGNPNKKADTESLSFIISHQSVENEEEYRLKEWTKVISYGEITTERKTRLGAIEEGVLYRLIKLKYRFENQERRCNWIINKNTFINSNKIYAEISRDRNDKSTIIGYWDLIDWLYDTSDIGKSDAAPYMKLRYKHFIATAAYTQPSNPHITRNMEGTPFRALQDFKHLDAFEYEFNDIRLPYYLEAKKEGKKEKGGDWIDGESYSYSDFSRLRVTRYVYRVYKKNAILLGDLVKRDGVRDYGGWNFGLEKSVKSNGVWEGWQSANVLSKRKISSNYYFANDIPYYSKGFDWADTYKTDFDSGSTLDAVMLETDATANYEPKDIRFRVNKEQIIETNSECKVQSKYNFFPVNLSWDYLEGAVNLTDGLTWTDGSSENSIAGYQEITLTDTSTYSYAIVKAQGEEVKHLNSDDEIIIYRMEEVEIPAPQYSTKFECEVCDGTWNAPESVTDGEHVGCTIKVLRRDRGTQLKVGEPTLIEGVTELKIISEKTSGSIETKIKRLPLSYTITQKTKINGGEEKVTHEEEVHGHDINSVRIGENGDEIYSLASDFECMIDTDNHANDLVSYEVTANTDDGSTTIASTAKQDDDFYNPPFQTSDFTVSGDNNIGGVFVCSGQSAITVTADTDRAFHVVNASSAKTVTVRDIEGVLISNVAIEEGVEIADKAEVEESTKSVTKLTEPDYAVVANVKKYIVLSDYSRIPNQQTFDTAVHSYKLIEDENIYLEESDDDKQIVFDCLSKVNLPGSPPAAFSFTGINIATEPIPLASPDNHLINGELVHYMKPRSEVRVSYTSNAFSVETLELESQASKLNIDQSEVSASQVGKFQIKDGGNEIRGIHVTDQTSLEVIVPALSNGFKHAFVFKNDSPVEGNKIDFKEESTGEIIGEEGAHYRKHGVILKRVNGEYVFESIIGPRPRLGINDNQENHVEELANRVFVQKNVDWNIIYASDNLKLNFLKLTDNTPEIVEYDASVFSRSRQSFYIKNESEEIKIIKFFNGDKQLDFSNDVGDKVSTVPVESLGITKVTFKEANSFISYGQKKNVTKDVQNFYYESNRPGINKTICTDLGGVWDADSEECRVYANKIENEWLSHVEPGILMFDDTISPKKDLLVDGYYYFSTRKIGGVRFILPANAFETGGVEPVVKFSSADDFRVMVIPDSPSHADMEKDVYLIKGANTVSEDDDDTFTKDERYTLDYSSASNGLKVCTIPLFPSIDRENQHDPKVIHKGKGLPHHSFDASALDPSFQDLDDLDPSQEVLLAASMAFSFKVSGGEIVPSLLSAEALVEGDQQDTQAEEVYFVVTSDQKIVRIVDKTITTIDLTKVSTPVILIINELPEDDPDNPSSISILPETTTKIARRSAMKAVYDLSSESYTLTEVQFYEMVYSGANLLGGYRELNKFYEKSDYNGKVLLFNTSVKIEGSSTAIKWIDLNKHICTDEDALQITYAYNNTNLSEDKYYILDTPLYIKQPTNGFIINKSNNVVGMGESDVLYPDEVWSDPGFLPSPNLRSQDYFIKLYNHTVTPKAYRPEDEQGEIVNFCRLNKLSPKSRVYLNKAGEAIAIEAERGGLAVDIVGEGAWPDVEPYKYGITLYGNKLNSSKKINFEFNYYDQWKEGKVYNDLIYGKRIPSRALANTIGFSVNTGNESIIKCIFFDERTGEATFSGINKDEEYAVIARDYKPSTNSRDSREEAEEVTPFVKYNGTKYFDGGTFMGEGDVSTYSISSLDFANVKVSLLSDLLEEEEGEGGSLVKVDPVVHPEVETTTVSEGGEDVVIAEPAWRTIPEDNKTITVTDDYEDGASYITGSIWNLVSNESDTAVVGEVYSFSNGVDFTVDMIDNSGSTFYGILVGGNINSGATGTYNPSKEIKESNRWGTITKPSNGEMLKGYRWSNFLVSHSSNYIDMQSLIEDEDIKKKCYFITIKKHKEATYVLNVKDPTLIKTAEDKNNIYIFRKATRDDPPFNRYNKIEGVELKESNVPDGIARVKIDKVHIFTPDDSYPIITTDNQAFKEEISLSESKKAEIMSRQAPPIVGSVGSTTNMLLEMTPKATIISAEEVLEDRNEYLEDVALNPTKNYANQIGSPGGIVFYLTEGGQTTDKLRVRLSRLVGRRVILKDYSDNPRIKNLKKNGIAHQLKYILEGEIKSAYKYDEIVYKGTVKIGSNLWEKTNVTIGTNIITADGLFDGDAIVFYTWDGNEDLQTNKVYFIKFTGTADTYNLYRAKKLPENFKETFSGSGLEKVEFRVVSKATLKGNEGFYRNSDYIIVNKTCFRNRTSANSSLLKLGLETYSFEYREDISGIVANQGGPVSVYELDKEDGDIFNSRNNLVRNFYVLKYHKTTYDSEAEEWHNKRTVILHLTKGRTYRYFIKDNVNKIIYGPDAGDKLDSETDPVLGTKGTFEAKQEQVEIVFDKDTEIKPTIKQDEGVLDGELPPPLQIGGVEKVGNIWHGEAFDRGVPTGLVDGEYKNVKLSAHKLDEYGEAVGEPPYDETDITVDIYVEDTFIVEDGPRAIKVVNRGSGHRIGQPLVIAYDSSESIPFNGGGNPNPNNTIYGGVDPDTEEEGEDAYWEITMEVLPPLWGDIQQPTVAVKDSSVDFSKDISLGICILEELKYEETNKDLPFKPHSSGPNWIMGSPFFIGGDSEVSDDGAHEIFMSRSGSATGSHTGMDDTLLSLGESSDDFGPPIFDKFLPAKVDTIHPHVKKIKGGENVELSWTMGEKYWNGFWLNERKYLPKSYRYTVHRKRGGEDEEIGDGIAKSYSNPDVTADVYLYKTRIRTFNQETCEAADGTWDESEGTCSVDISGVGNIVSAGNHNHGTHTNVKLIGGSTWVTGSPRAVATVVIDDGSEVFEDAGKIKSVTITDGGEGYAVGEKLTIPAVRPSTSTSGIGGADATCEVTVVEAVDLTDKTTRIKLDELGGEVKYDRDLLRYTLKSNRNGTLEYVPGSNEKHLLYSRKKYSSKAFFPYYKQGKIQIIGKDLERFQRRTFNPEKYEEGDTFYVKVSEELLHTAGGPRNPDDEALKELTSDLMRLPLSWVSSFSASDIQDSQKFRDVREDVDKVTLEIIANSDNKGIELPESLLQVMVPHLLPETPLLPVRTTLPNWYRENGKGYLEMIRNLFFRITFTSARACIYDPIVEGRVSSVKLLNNGGNYLSKPTVTFDSPTAGYTINDGTGKMIPFHRQSEGEAKLDTQGKISQIIVTDPGSGYGWKEGGYQYEKTDVKPIVYNLLKIKSGAIPNDGYIAGAGAFLNEKFFSYGHQLANETSRKIDPVSVTVTANPEDAESNILSMGMTRSEFKIVNNLYSEQDEAISEEEENYKAHKMSEKSFMGGAPRSPGAGLFQETHQDDIGNFTEGPASLGFINMTPDEEGGQGQEDDADATLDTSPQGTSQLDNRETDPTSSETTAKALGIVNDASLVDYRIRRRPFSKASHPWISGMSSSTRPDYPMFFGNAPSTEISADAFNNMVDAANSLNKVNIDLPVYVRIKKHTETSYRHVPDWGLRSKNSIDEINQHYEDNPLVQEFYNKDWKEKNKANSDKDINITDEGILYKNGNYPDSWEGYPTGETTVPKILEEGDIICGTTFEDGRLFDGFSTKAYHGGNAPVRPKNWSRFDHALDLPFYELNLHSVNQRRIATSIAAGTLVASFSEPPETYVKELNSIGSIELYSQVDHLLTYGCFSKEDSVHQLFIETTLIWCEYEILPFGTYAEAALGKDLLSNLDKNKTIYEGVLSSQERSCRWGAKPEIGGSDDLFSVCPSDALTNLFLTVDTGTVKSGPIEDDSDGSNTSVIVPAKGIIKIDLDKDQSSGVRGLISGIYGSVSVGHANNDGTVSCINTCDPFKTIWLTFPRGKNNGFILNLDITKTDGADCF